MDTNFIIAANQPEEALRPADQTVDLIATMADTLGMDLPPMLEGAVDPAMPVIDLDPTAFTDLTPAPADVDLAGEEAVAGVEEDVLALLAEDFPSEGDDYAEQMPDMSPLLPAVQQLQDAMNPMNLDELRRAVTAGSLGGKTDPYGDRLRYTIRRLVRGA